MVFHDGRKEKTMGVRTGRLIACLFMLPVAGVTQTTAFPYCDLSMDDDSRWMKEPEHWWPPEFYFRSGLNAGARRNLESKAREGLKQSTAHTPPGATRRMNSQ